MERSGWSMRRVVCTPGRDVGAAARLAHFGGLGGLALEDTHVVLQRTHELLLRLLTYHRSCRRRRRRRQKKKIKQQKQQQKK